MYEWLDSALEVYIPKRTMHRSSLSPWISKETSHLIKCLKTARKRYGESHTKVEDLAYQVEMKATNDKISYEQNMGKIYNNALQIFQSFQERKFTKKDNLWKSISWRWFIQSQPLCDVICLSIHAFNNLSLNEWKFKCESYQRYPLQRKGSHDYM